MADTDVKVDPEGSSQETEQSMAILSSEFGQGFVCTMGYECRHRDPYSQPEGGWVTVYLRILLLLCSSCCLCAGTKKMEYKSRQWHEKCFACFVCKTPIGTKSFIPREQDIYCSGCYEEKFATRCVKCTKVWNTSFCESKHEMFSFIFMLTDYHYWRCDLQERPLASWVLYLYPLWQVSCRPTIHFQGRETILRWMLWRALRKTVHVLLQAHHRYFTPT